MPVTESEAREFLRERSSNPPPNPDRVEQVFRSGRRLRRRQTLGTGVIAAAAVAVTVAGSISVLQVGNGPQRGEPAAGHPGIPETFSRADGRIYRRVATATMNTPHQQSVSVTVPVRGKALAAVGICRGGDMNSNVFIKVGPSIGPAHFTCASPGRFRGVQGIRDVQDLRAGGRGASQVGLTFVTAAGMRAVPGALASPGPGARRLTPPPSPPAQWAFGVYEWTPPAKPRTPPPAPQMPDKVIDEEDKADHGIRRIEAKSGTWPGRSTVRLTVPYRGRTLYVAAACAGSADGAILPSYRVNGRIVDGTGCGEVFPGEDVSQVALPRPPDGTKDVTIEVRFGPAPTAVAPPDMYSKLPGSWTVAAYEAMK
jgi:hypothetical protein